MKEIFSVSIFGSPLGYIYKNSGNGESPIIYDMMKETLQDFCQRKKRTFQIKPKVLRPHKNLAKELEMFQLFLIGFLPEIFSRISRY